MTRNCLFYESQQNCFHFCRNHHLVGSRTRRSLAESNSTCINIKSNILNNNFTTIESAAASNNNANNNSNNANNNNNNEEEHPPMIGVPNLKVRKQEKHMNIQIIFKALFLSKLASDLTGLFCLLFDHTMSASL